MGNVDMKLKEGVVLSEKGLPYEREEILPMNVPPEFKKISPLGKIPAYRDGEVTLCDSSVICAYLERVHPERNYGKLFRFDQQPLPDLLAYYELRRRVLVPVLRGLKPHGSQQSVGIRSSSSKPRARRVGRSD